MLTKLIALLIVVSLSGCSTAPYNGPSPSEGGSPAVSSTATTDRPAPPTMESSESASDTADTPPNHGRELAKAAKVAAGAVLLTVVFVFYAAVSLAAALAV